MIKRLASASICFALVSAAAADTGAKDVSNPENSAAEESAAGLDAFVETAIAGGLLVAPEDGVVAQDPAAQAELVAICAEPYPLDFSVVKSLRRFTELPRLAAEDDTLPDARRLTDLKAKMALGLYAEAKSLITLTPDAEWRTHKKFIALMENRDRPDVAYFEKLASCHPEGRTLACRSAAGGL